MSKKRVCGLLTAAALLLSCLGVSGCAAKQAAVEPMEPEEVNTLTFDAIGGADVMPIAGYYGPHLSDYCYNGERQPSFVTDEFMKLTAESGINLLNHSYLNYSASAKAVHDLLDYGEKYGVGICVYDAKVAGALGDSTPSLTMTAEQIAAYSRHPAFCGLYVADEPQWAGFHLGDGTRTIDLYAPSLQNLRTLGVYGYVNALPDYNGKPEQYRAYLREMITKMDLPYLSVDAYIWDKSNMDFHNYFYIMDEVRDAALEANIPFWTFVQTGSQWNDGQKHFDSDPNYVLNNKQFQWTVSVNLAWGVQGIQYFTLIQPYHFSWALTEPFDFNRNGMVGAWGNINEWYYYAQESNRQIAAVDEVLMHSKSKGVLVYGDRAKQDTAGLKGIIQADGWRELVDLEATGDVMVGCFNYQGKTALYVVNYDYEYAQDITLKLNKKHNVTVIYDAETEHYSAKNLTLPMQAGYGALIVIDD